MYVYICAYVVLSICIDRCVSICVCLFRGVRWSRSVDHRGPNHMFVGFVVISNLIERRTYTHIHKKKRRKSILLFYQILSGLRSLGREISSESLSRYTICSCEKRRGVQKSLLHTQSVPFEDDGARHKPNISDR